MAVALMQDIIREHPGLTLKDINIRSAGTLGLVGREAHPNAQTAVEEYGLSLQGHFSSPVSKKIVDWADVIAAMDTSVKEAIVGSYPEVSHKIRNLDIADPIGEPLEVYRQCAQQIRENCISRVLPLLK